MSSKARLPGHDQASLRRQWQPARNNLELAQSQVPAAIIQQTRLDPTSLAPQRVLQLQRALGNRTVGQILAQADQRQPVQREIMAGKQGIKPTIPVLLSTSAVIQRIYLWDRKKEKKPRWSDEEKPPKGYLPSGQYNDQEHGEDKLYARMADTDLFYGISYEDNPEMEKFLENLGKVAEQNQINIETPEGFTAALEKYEQSGQTPLLDVAVYQAIYGGSSGWARYTPFIKGGVHNAWAKGIQELNPRLKWANDPAGFGCQVAMITALMNNGSVRFLLDGMKNIKGIIEGSAYKSKVTSHELRFVVGMLDEPINISKDKQIRATDGVNVFFYLNQQLIPAGQLPLIGQD